MCSDLPEFVNEATRVATTSRCGPQRSDACVRTENAARADTALSTRSADLSQSNHMRDDWFLQVGKRSSRQLLKIVPEFYVQGLAAKNLSTDGVGISA